MVSVADLRKQGNKIRIIHRRHYATNELYPYFFLASRYELNEFLYENAPIEVYGPSEMGGQTVLQITTPDGKNSEGIAECNWKDHYCRKIGVELALSRAIQALSDGVNT